MAARGGTMQWCRAVGIGVAGIGTATEQVIDDCYMAVEAGYVEAGKTTVVA